MAYVFISYRRQDNLKHPDGELPFPYRVKEYFNLRYGPDFCFMDTELNRGEWSPQLQEAITDSTVFLLFLTPGCLDFRAGEDIFRREIKEAFDQEKVIVPVRYVAYSDEAGKRLEATFSPPENDALYISVMKRVNDTQTVFFDPLAGDRGYSSTLGSIADKVAEPVMDSVFRKMRSYAADILENNEKSQLGTTPFDPMLLAPVSVENIGKPFEDLYQAIENATSLIPTNPILLTATGGQGKSTQMIRFGQKLLGDAAEGGRKDCLVCYFHLYELDSFPNGISLVDKMLDALCVPSSVRKHVAEDMRDIKEKHKYFLLLDGLDEISSGHPSLGKILELSSPASNTAYHNLQIVVAGRSDLRRVFGENTVINMRLDKLTRDMAKKWLEKKGKEVNIEAYDRIIDSPMLLLLACESENPKVREHIKRRMENKASPVFSKGEVLWNYMEYLLGKLTWERIPEADKSLADELIHHILPSVTFNRFFMKDTMETSESDVSRAIGSDRGELIEILRKYFPGLIRIQDDKCTFSHRLFLDYFAMVHVANVYKKLLDGGELNSKEYTCLFHRKFLDAPEYNDLLVSILPGVLAKTNELERRTIDEIHSIIEDNEYGEKVQQNIHMLSAVYPYWTVKAWTPYYNKLTEERRKVYAGFVRDAFTGLKSVAEMFCEVSDESKEQPRFAASCVSFVCCVLSQVYRCGSLLMSNTGITKIPGVEADLNTSLQYAMKALRMYEKDNELIDGFNYVGKAFNRARENLLNRKRMDKRIALRKDDLMLTDELLAPVKDGFSKEVLEEVIRAKEGDVLTEEAALRRIDVLWQLAEYWLRESEKKECVLSMNLLALMDEMAQEEKPEKERDYRKAYQIYDKGSAKRQAVSPYSAMKAAQMLAQGKVGLDIGGNACPVEIAVPKLTVEKSIQLHEIALSGGGYWGQIALCRGQLYMHYGLDLENLTALTRVNAVRKAYDHFSVAFEQWKGAILVSIEWFTAGLELASLSPVMREQIHKDLTEKVQRHFGTLLSKFANDVTQERHADKWTPSSLVFREYCQRIRELITKYKNTVVELNIVELVDQWNSCMDAQETKLANLEVAHG